MCAGFLLSVKRVPPQPVHTRVRVERRFFFFFRTVFFFFLASSQSRYITGVFERYTRARRGSTSTSISPWCACTGTRTTICCPWSCCCSSSFSSVRQSVHDGILLYTCHTVRLSRSRKPNRYYMGVSSSSPPSPSPPPPSAPSLPAVQENIRLLVQRGCPINEPV